MLAVLTDSQVAWLALKHGLNHEREPKHRLTLLGRRVALWMKNFPTNVRQVLIVLCESHVGTNLNMLADRSVPSPADRDHLPDLTGRILMPGAYIHQDRWQCLRPRGLAERLCTDANTRVLAKATEITGTLVLPRWLPPASLARTGRSICDQCDGLWPKTSHCPITATHTAAVVVIVLRGTSCKCSTG